MVHVNRKTSPPTAKGKNTNGEINEWFIKHCGKHIVCKWTQTVQTSLRTAGEYHIRISQFVHTISIMELFLDVQHMT